MLPCWEAERPPPPVAAGASREHPNRISSSSRTSPRRAIRTTNLLERLFVEERRRLKIIPNSFGEKPVLKLMFGAMIRAAERWRAIKFTDFERRQIAAVRQDLDEEYQAQIATPARSSAPQNPSRLSSTPRT